MDKIEQEKGLQKVANHLGEQMSRLIRTKGSEVDWEERCDNHLKAASICRNIAGVKDRIARQRAWLRSHLEATPEEKLQIKARLDEMKKAKSELLDEYTNLQLP